MDSRNCYLDLDDASEDKGSYSSGWKNRANENMASRHEEEANTTRSLEVAHTTNHIENVVSAWKYKHKLSHFDSWAKRCLGIETTANGYAVDLSSNISRAGEEISWLTKDSWFDDKTNLVALEVVLILPNQGDIVAFCLVIKRMTEIESHYFVIREKVISLPRWSSYGILLLFCVNWLRGFGGKFPHKTRIAKKPEATLLLLISFVVSSFVVEIMMQKSLGKTFSTQAADSSVDKRLYQVVFLEALLKGFQGTAVFLIAIRTARLMMLVMKKERMAGAVGSQWMLKLWLIQFLVVMAFSCSIYVNAFNDQADMRCFSSIVIAFFFSLAKPSNQLTALRSFSGWNYFWIATTLIFTKYAFFAFVFNELRQQVIVIAQEKTEAKTLAKNRAKRNNEGLKRIGEFTDGKNEVKETQKRRQCGNQRLFKMKKKKNQEQLFSGRKESIEEFLAMRIRKLAMFMNENYLDDVGWDVFFFNRLCNVKEHKEIERKLARFCQDRSGEKTITNCREHKRFQRKKTEGKQSYKRKEIFEDEPLRLKVPKIKLGRKSYEQVNLRKKRTVEYNSSDVAEETRGNRQHQLEYSRK